MFRLDHFIMGCCALIAGWGVCGASEQCEPPASDGGVYHVEPLDSGFRLNLDCSRYYRGADAIEPPGGSYLQLVDELASANGRIPLFLTKSVANRIPCTTEWFAPNEEELLRAFMASAGVEAVVDGEFLLIAEKEKLEEQKVVVFAYVIAPSESAVQIELERTARLLLAQLPVRYWGGSWGDRVWLELGYYQVPEEDDTYLVVPTKGDIGGINPDRLMKVRLGLSDHVECLWSVPGVGTLISEVREDFDNDGVRDYVFEGVDRAGTAAWPNLVLSGADGRRLLEFSGRAVVVERTSGRVRRIGVDRSGGLVLQLSPETETFVEMPAAQPSEAAKAQGALPALGYGVLDAMAGAGADPATLYAYFFPNAGFPCYSKDVVVVRAAGNAMGAVRTRLVDGWEPEEWGAAERLKYPEVTLVYVHERTKLPDWAPEN